MSRLIGQTINRPAYEVASEHQNTDPLDAKGRRMALTKSLIPMRKRSAILVFEEAEDLFRGSLFRASFAQERKGRFNQLLETNPVPGITVRELCNRLAREGFPVTMRMIERDLEGLSSLFDLTDEQDPSSRAKRWYYVTGKVPELGSVDLIDAVSLSLSGMSWKPFCRAHYCNQSPRRSAGRAPNSRRCHRWASPAGRKRCAMSMVLWKCCRRESQLPPWTRSRPPSWRIDRWN